MTEEQVKAASSGTTSPIPDQNATLAITLRSSYSAAGVDYRVRFGFSRETGELMAVFLDPPENACGDVHAKLIETYGEATVVRNEGGGLLREISWRDQERGNVVALMEFNRSCSVKYTALAKRSTGL